MTHMTAHQLRRIEDLLLDIPAFCRQGSEALLKNFLSDSRPLRRVRPSSLPRHDGRASGERSGCRQGVTCAGGALSPGWAV
jgi:hypothetical protein